MSDLIPYTMRLFLDNNDDDNGAAIQTYSRVKIPITIPYIVIIISNVSNVIIMSKHY